MYFTSQNKSYLPILFNIICVLSAKIDSKRIKNICYHHHGSRDNNLKFDNLTSAFSLFY